MLHFFTMDPSEIFAHFDRRLRPWASGPLHRVYEGNIPVGLVAHVDTVPHANGSFPPDIRRVGNILTASKGLGADDRAGVAAIDVLLPCRPWVILLDQEEVGCLGARELARHPAPPVKFLLELDRMNRNDVVYYDYDPDWDPTFSGWLESFGFVRARGSCSDIAVLGPAWNLACANLSIGYEKQHTLQERLHLDWWQETVDKVATILERQCEVGRFPFSSLAA